MSCISLYQHSNILIIIMINVKQKFIDFIEQSNILSSKDYMYPQIRYEEAGLVRAYNDSTLFCPSGMQGYEDKFRDQKSYKDSHAITIANIQPCLRVNDLNQIGDGSHLLYFNMMGLFSFYDMTVTTAVFFWENFLHELGVIVTHATVHPDTQPSWGKMYDVHEIPVKEDDGCRWSNGSDLEGYCTEFFVDDIEIGNIVQIGKHIDCGFGYERINNLVNHRIVKGPEEILKETIWEIIKAGYIPGPNNQSYILRKLYTRLIKLGGTIDKFEGVESAKYFKQEVERQKAIQEKYNRLKYRYRDRTAEWWFDTHGIDITEVIEV